MPGFAALGTKGEECRRAKQTPEDVALKISGKRRLFEDST
jgi:hypothetical protein